MEPLFNTLEEAAVIHDALLIQRTLETFTATCLHATDTERHDAHRKLAVINTLLGTSPKTNTHP